MPSTVVSFHRCFAEQVEQLARGVRPGSRRPRTRAIQASLSHELLLAGVRVVHAVDAFGLQRHVVGAWRTRGSGAGRASREDRGRDSRLLRRGSPRTDAR